MADTKITGLTEDTTLADADLIPTVTDVATTPVNRKMTAANVATSTPFASRYRRPGFAWTPSASIIAEAVPHWATTSNGGLLTSGRAFLVPIWLQAGDSIASITFVSATTAVGTPTNQWFALCDDDCVVLRVTSDDTTTAWATSTAKTLNLTSAYVIPTSAVYRLAVVVAATTVPTLRSTPISNGMPTRVINGNTGLTTPSAEATDLNAGASAANSNVPYCYVS